MEQNPVTRYQEDYRWENIPVLEYKEAGAPFEAITRQVLFPGLAELPTQVRYFEIADGGHSTLERHEHIHLVIILRGRGKALLGKKVVEVGEHDVVTIPSQTWHQFRATAGVPLGFLCLVNTERDRPILPDAKDLQDLKQNPAVADFIRY